MKYRKKPVVVEAVQWTGSNYYELRKFLKDSCTVDIYDAAWKAGQGAPVAVFKIKTLEGDMTASVGDYIIKGVQGEYYPCKPDIFEQTYELAE